MKINGNVIKIIAHKGGTYWNGENFSYINNSIKDGASIIELDIQHKLFGGYIVQHPIGVPEYDREIFFPYRGRLENALKVINNQAMVYLDIKDENINPKSLIKFVRKYNNNTIIVSSFNKNYLKKFNNIDDNLIINLQCLIEEECINNAKEIGAQWINPVPILLSEKFAKDIQNAGFKFVPAGIEDYNKTKEYISWGAYAISVYDINKFKQSLNNTTKIIS